jgi:hypothetical protein
VPQFAIACNINLGGACTQFAAVVNTNDYAVGCSFGGVAGGRKIVHGIQGCPAQNKSGSLTDSAENR